VADGRSDVVEGLLASDEMSAWLSSVSGGESGSIDNVRWRISAELTNNEHWDAPHVSDDVWELLLEVVSKSSDEVATVSIWIDLRPQQPVVYDVELGALECDMRKVVWYGVDAVLSGVQRCLLNGKWRPSNATVIMTGPTVKKLKSTVGWDKGADTHHAFGDATAPPECVTAEKVDVAHYSTASGVHHGRISAGDVPPALQVVSGVNGGKDIAMATLSVHCGAHIYYQNTTSCARLNKVSYLHYGRKHGPCVRDGLLAAGLVAGLEGDGTGSVSLVTREGSIFSAKTVWSDAVVGGEPRIVTTRDPVSTYRALIAMAMMQRWEVVADDASATIVSFPQGYESEARRVQVMEGPSFAARWIDLLSRDEIGTDAWFDTSEAGLDYWCSGVARYLMREHVSRGRLTLCERLLVSDNNVFSSFKHIKVGATHGNRQPVDLVVDLERFNTEVGGVPATYVYALGVTRSVAGQYMGSYYVVDDNQDLESMIEAADLNNAHRTNARTLYASAGGRGNAGEALEALRTAVERHPNIRIYGKGVDDDDATLQGDHDMVTRLFTRNKVHPNSRRLRELGSMMGKVEQLAEGVGWPGDHNPAQETVLFAHAGGFFDELPELDEVGGLTLDEVLAP
jgi:hypothetical protein